MFSRLEQVLGLLLIAAVLLDVFLTVLYARIGTGIVSQHLARTTWRFFRFASRAFERRRGLVLSLCGPIILVLLVGAWVFGLTCGGALVIQPALGKSVVATTGPTPTDFVTAMYVAGDSLTTVGTSDLAPRTSFFRLFNTFESLMGMSIITLTLTYFLEVYNALQQRNTFSLKIHLATAETGDAAEMIAGIGPEGEFHPGYAHLAEMSAEMIGLKESHHFYPVLFYFRFHDPHYAVARPALVVLDAVTLIKSALDDREYAWLKESAAVAQLWRASMHLLTVLAVAFLPGGIPEVPGPPDQQTLDRWHRRYYAGVRRLRQAGIKTFADEKLGAEVYVSLRARWDRYIKVFGHFMAQEQDIIDRAASNPEDADERQDFRQRLRSAG